MEISSKCTKNRGHRVWWKRILSDIRVRVIGILVFIIIIGIGVPYFIVSHFNRLKSEKSVNQECILEHALRIDCMPGIAEEDKTQENCKILQCCWEEFGSSVPICFHPHPAKYTYDIQHVQQEVSGYKLQLSPNFENTSLLTPAKKQVLVDIEFWTANHLRILIYDEASFDPSKYIPYNETGKSENVITNYEVIFTHSGRFYFEVHRKGPEIKGNTRTPIFNTYYGPLIVSEGLTEITTLLPSFNLYGIGQNRKSTFRHDFKCSKKNVLFSHISLDDDAQQFSDPSAGVHPFYMVMEDNGWAHGVLLVNTLPTEIITSGTPSVTFRTMGTRMDLHLFLGPNPADVVKQLTEYVGRPTLPPYWALGYHSCRLASNWNESTAFIRFAHSKRIPHESDCGSSDLFSPGGSDMQSNAKDFVKELKESGRKFLVLFLPHVAVEKRGASRSIDNQAYREGLKFGTNVFVRDAGTQGIFFGTLESELKVAYPDFFEGTNVNIWLKDQLQKLLKKCDFDGLLLHLNTPLNDVEASFGNESTCGKNEKVYLFSSRSDYFNNNTICMDALHATDEPHIHLHNIYSYKHLAMVKSAIKFLKKFEKRRPLLSSMSTFLGSGTYGGYWGGLHNSSWDNMKGTVAQMLDFSLFGIPFSGSPACGTHGLIDSLLCSRWFQLATFQPFAFSYRNDHLDILLSSRRLTSTGRSMLQLRYSLLPYLYGLFFNATYRGETVIRPLFFEFPKTSATYGIDEQFMWGSSLLVSPVLEPFVQKTRAFFPPGCWYDYYSGRKVAESAEGIYKDLSSAEHHINLHIRGGHIIPTQISGLTTDESRKQNFTITIALNCVGKGSGLSNILGSNNTLAIGEVFIDDGYSIDTIAQGKYTLISLSLNGRVLSIHANRELDVIPDNVSHILNTIHFYGLPEKPFKFFLNGTETSFVYNSVFKSATLDGLQLHIAQTHILTWTPTT